MNYLKKKFSVIMGSKKYNKNYDKIFPKSQCCNANVKVEGKTTRYYVCLKCGKACDVK